MDLLFCPLRKIWVASLPEERVRQVLIQEMIFRLGYPASNIAIEKSLDQLPHLQNKNALPRRRADLIVFAKDIHPQHLLYPLLLIECKAVPLRKPLLRQLLGYNKYIGAYFVAAVNQTMAYLWSHHPQCQNIEFHQGLLPYTQLLERVSIKC